MAKTTPTLISSETARAEGKATYFTGKPCPQGHIAKRYVSSRACVVCSAEAKRKWAKGNREQLRTYDNEYYSTHKIQIRAWVRRWIASNPKRHAENKKKDYLKHKPRRVATMRQWRKNNPERVMALHRKKVAAHPEHYRAYKRNNKAQRKRAPGKHNGADILQILNAQRGKCAYCSGDLGKKKHVDHIVPLARGGSNNRANLQLLCPTCNLTKSAKDPIEFAQERGMLL